MMSRPPKTTGSPPKSAATEDVPMRFAFADPPYYGCGASHYGAHHPEAAVWDDKSTHLALVARLVDEYPDGWVLSCNPADLRWLLPACPEDARVGAWTKTWHQIRPTTTQYAWEPVIWRGGRKDPKRSPMVRDWIACVPTRQKGLKGAKPPPSTGGSWTYSGGGTGTPWMTCSLGPAAWAVGSPKS